jgi:hypothetical protein
VVLKDGRVDTVIRPWGPNDEGSGVPLAKALLGATSSLVEDGDTACTLSRDEESGVGWETRAVLIVCGARHLKVELGSDGTKEWAAVGEGLGGTPAAARIQQ